MKQLFAFLGLMLAVQSLSGQDPAYPSAPVAAGNIVKAEYFFDTDPGFGNAVNIPVSAATDLPNVLATINTSALTNGTHRIYIRTLNIEGQWCISNFETFVVDFDPPHQTPPSAPGNIIKAEYFFDTDPGFGNGADIPVSASTDLANVLATLNTSALSNGTHRIYLRTLNIEGKWSINNIHEFLVDFNPAYPATPAAAGNLVKAEYFFDTDPGFGNGTDIPVTAATDLPNIPAVVNTSSLSTGTHRIFLRTLNVEGKWSISNEGEFIVDVNPAYPAAPVPAGNIIKAEYFLDTDPGFGNGINIPVVPATDVSNIAATINMAGLSNGTHRIYLRTLNIDGKWSISNLSEFVYDADPAYVAASAVPGNITHAEYFFNTDPGFGNGTPVNLTPLIDISNHSFPADVSALPDGNHVLYVRSKDDWSITSIDSFFKGIALPLHLISFSARKSGDIIRLYWTTDNEINTSHFDVEKSRNGTAYAKTGEVAASNSSGRNEYTFDDSQPFDGANYYRLKQADRDGKYTYSPVIRVSIDGNELAWSLSPNPANNLINITYAGKKATVTISIYDAQGRLVKKQTQRNEVPVKMDVKQLRQGLYFIQLSDGETVQQGKFIVQ